MSLKIMSEEYIELSEIDHCLLRPDAFIGSIKLESVNKYVINFNENGQPFFVKKDMLYSDGFCRPFLEGFSNMIDNLNRSIKEKVDVGMIKVETDGKNITFYNEGRAINIMRHEKSNNVWTPEMIFGRLRTGSSFNDDGERYILGRNGLGAKLMNICSKRFDIEIGNKEQKMLYKQTFKNNMREKEEANISEYKGNVSYVKITYLIDFDYFYEGQNLEKKYSNDMIALFLKYIIDASFTCGKEIYFNDIKFDYSNFEEYIGLYGINLSEKKHIIFKDKESEICIVDSPHDKNVFSFVNGVAVESGVHIEAWMDLITEIIVPKFTEKKGGKKKINKGHVREHLTIFLRCKLNKPSFDSQIKTSLNGPKPKITIEYKVLEQMYEWKMMDALESYIRSKDDKTLKKTDGKKNKYTQVPKVDDAPSAGSSDSYKCCLCLSEGDSAHNLALSIMGKMDKSMREYFGAFPLKGKMLNVTNATVEQVVDNVEISALKEVLGLKDNVDYMDDKNFNTLRYGRVIIMSDADLDGIHIRMLCINIFGMNYRTLLQRGFISALITPLIKCTIPGQIRWFYSGSEYKNWINEDKNRNKYPIKFYKGLGGFSKPEDIKYIADEFLLINYVWDNDAEKMLTLAFDKNHTDMRKEWLNKWQRTMEMYVPKVKNENRNISETIDTELILFSHYSLIRSIPNIIDGLKPVQRKVLYVALNDLKKSTKLDNFAGTVIEKADYNHGPVSMIETIIGMCQSYSGSNNIPFLVGEGQFGTRRKNGDDHAESRYLSVNISPITKYIFRKEDNIILTKNMDTDEGEGHEPHVYYPIIPCCLINGASGIGTGYNTDTPCYNPKEIIDWLKKIIYSKKSKLSVELPVLLPWYKYYKGKIYVDDKGNIISEGLFEIDKKNNKICWVTEFPIGLSEKHYKEKCLKSMIINKIIAGYKSHSTLNEVDIDINMRLDGMSNPSLNKLKLTRKICINNMCYFGLDDKIKKYNNTTDIMKEFFVNRLEMYGKRKEMILKELNSEIKSKTLKARFIEDVVLEKINLKNRVKSELVMEMKKLGYLEEFLDMGIKYLTKEGLEHLRKDIDKTKNEFISYKEKDILDIWEEELSSLNAKL